MYFGQELALGCYINHFDYVWPYAVIGDFFHCALVNIVDSLSVVYNAMFLYDFAPNHAVRLHSVPATPWK